MSVPRLTWNATDVAAALPLRRLFALAALSLVACSSGTPAAIPPASQPARSSPPVVSPPVVSSPGTSSVAGSVAGSATVSGFAGEAHPSLPPGHPGVVSAAAIGAPEPMHDDIGTQVVNFVAVPFVVWNDTAAAVEGLKMNATAVDPTSGTKHDGTLGALTPTHLEPGQWGLAVVQFLSASSLADGTRYDITFSSDDHLASRAVDLSVSDLGTDVASGRRTAQVTNATTQPLGSPFTAAVYCFDHDRVVSTQVWNPSAGPDGFTFAPGATSSIFFVVDAACPSFLVAAVTLRQ